MVNISYHLENKKLIKSIGLKTSENLKLCSNKKESNLEVHISDFHNAKLAELQSWKESDVYIEVPYNGQNLVSLRWVCTLKDIDNEVVPKAWLVAKGLEDAEKDFVATDPPTCLRETLRLLIALTLQNNSELSAINIKTAFLQGKPITIDLYDIPPKEANMSYIWKLKKCIYGLVDPSTNWYDSQKSFLLSFGLSASKSDPSMFYYTENEIVSGFIAVHVDDILWSGSNNFEHIMITKLQNCFIIGKEKSMSFQYLGLNISENSMKHW